MVVALVGAPLHARTEKHLLEVQPLSVCVASVCVLREDGDEGRSSTAEFVSARNQ